MPARPLLILARKDRLHTRCRPVAHHINKSFPEGAPEASRVRQLSGRAHEHIVQLPFYIFSSGADGLPAVGSAEYAAQILLFPECGRLDHESVSKRLSENATMRWPPRSKLDIAQSSCRQQSTDKRSITFQSAYRAQRKWQNLKLPEPAEERSRPPIALSRFNGATAKSTTIDQQIGRVCYSIRADNLDDNLIPVDSDHLDILKRGEVRLVTRSNKGQRARLNCCSRHLE
jgi:hypothetical protein